jgi:hypothetical protein
MPITQSTIRSCTCGVGANNCRPHLQSDLCALIPDFVNYDPANMSRNTCSYDCSRSTLDPPLEPDITGIGVSFLHPTESSHLPETVS